MGEQTEKKYEFYLEINSFKDHNLYLRKAGEENYIQNENGQITDQQDSVSNKNSEETHGKKQHFEECWGFDNASDKLKDFDAWKEKFFPTLLEKYNINKEDCKVLVNGQEEVFNFFSQEEYLPYFEMDGQPIELLNDDVVEELLRCYKKESEYKENNIRVCLKNLIEQKKDELTIKRQDKKDKELEFKENQDKQQNLEKEYKETGFQIEKYKNEKENILEKINSIFDDKKISLKGKDKSLKDVKNREEVKVHINYENKIEREIKSLNVESDLKQKFNTLFSELSEKLKSSYDDSIEEKKVGFIIKKKIKFSFNETNFTGRVQSILKDFRNQAKNKIKSYYDEKINDLESKNNEIREGKENSITTNERLRQDIKNLEEEITEIVNFLQKYHELRNSTKQNSEESEENNNE